MRQGDGWVEVGTATTVGLRRLLVLGEPVETDRIRVRVLQSRAAPHLSTLGLYRSAPTHG